MGHSLLRTFACAALAASAAAAASASPALALGEQRSERPAPARTAGGEHPPAEPPDPPPLPPGPEWRESVTHAIPRDAIAA